VKGTIPDSVYLELCNRTKKSYQKINEEKKEAEEPYHRYKVEYARVYIQTNYSGSTSNISIALAREEFIAKPSVYRKKGAHALMGIPKFKVAKIGTCTYKIEQKISNVTHTPLIVSN
jgi:hypothetical protein